MEVTIVDVISYFKTLEKMFGLSISFHSVSCNGFFKKYVSEIGKYNSHCNSFCLSIKANPKLHKCCLLNQRFVLDCCSRDVFCGMAYCGMEEYIIPIAKNNITLGFISVTGNTKNFTETKRRINNIGKKFDVDAGFLIKCAESMKENKLDVKTISSLFKMPSSVLADLMFLYYDEYSTKNEINIYSEIITYITLNYNKKITVKQIAEYCHCSESYINHNFKKNNGLSIPEYVNLLRVKSAKKFLENTNYSISEIAYMVGFYEANYFSNTFKKLNRGISPKKYRENYKKQHQ